MNWFRYAREAPEESGAGGEEEVFHDAFSPEGWTGDVQEVPPTAMEESDVDDGNDPGGAAPPEDEPVAATQPEGWSDADWGEFQKQFPNGTPADLWKHYSELRTRFSRGEHKQAAEPAPAPEKEETPESWRAHNFSALGDIPTRGLSNLQRDQLGELMGIDPEAAASWSIANSHLLKEDEFNAIQNTWAQADPHGYRTFWSEQEELRRQSELEEQVGPSVDYATQQRQREGAELAQQEMPEIVAHLEPFKEWLQANPEIDQHLVTLKEPEQVKNALIATFYQFYGPYRMQMDATERAAATERERVATEEAAAQAAASENANKRARTATRTAPATPSGGEPSTDDIRARIMGATG